MSQSADKTAQPPPYSYEQLITDPKDLTVVANFVNFWPKGLSWLKRGDGNGGRVCLPGN